MSIQERKSRESAELRQRILDAALKVFAEQGYDKVSMRKIASLIDYSPTTIYRFFAGKEELLATIASYTYRDLTACFENVLADGHTRPVARLKSLVREYILFCLERPDMFRLFSDIACFEMENGVLYERLGGSRHRVYQSWFACIRESIAAGDLRVKDEMRVFLYLWDAVNGTIFQRIAYPKIPRKSPREAAADYLGLLFSGIERTKS